MKDIISFYIINGNRDLIYSQENISLAPEGKEHEYISNFLSILETIAMKIGEKEEELRIMVLGHSKFFLSKDKLTNVIFILKCEKDAKQKKIFEKLNKTKNLFIEKFTGNFNSPDDIKLKLMESFTGTLAEIIGNAKSVLYFIDSLKI